MYLFGETAEHGRRLQEKLRGLSDKDSTRSRSVQ